MTSPLSKLFRGVRRYRGERVSKPCVYALCRGGRLLYVGVTANLRRRIWAHDRRRISVSYAEFDSCNEASLAESAAILALAPKRNVNPNPQFAMLPIGARVFVTARRPMFVYRAKCDVKELNIKSPFKFTCRGVRGGISIRRIK